MLKTTFTDKGRLGLLLCLTGLLSFAGAASVRAGQDSQQYDNSQQNDNGPAITNGDNDADNSNMNSDNGAPMGADDGTADVDNASPDAQDPPSRVARLSYFDGSVSFQPGGNGDWAAAVRNRPVTIGDKIWADKDARVELQAGQASIRLGAMTALSFLNLDQNITQMRLAEGSINFRVRELREGDQYEVDTPNAAFTVTQAGAFRIDVNENGDGTIVTVLRGEGEVTAGGKSYKVSGGDLAEFNGTEGNVTYRSDRAPEPDDFDRWAASRDRKEEDSVSARYVSRDTVGYSDLDDNGTWNEEPEYGHVWYPNNVAVGWAPYSYGYWNYVGPWGWTWVDYSPWGFAPFHYGRWNNFGGRWGWCPGPRYGYPVYGPAFVGFLGGRGGFGFGIGVGVGWFPLGYGEIYRPWYHYRAGGAYIRNINIHNTYIRNVNNITNRNFHSNYAYAHNTAAVTATSRSAFANGQLVNRGANRVSAASLRNAQVTNRVGLAPTRASYASGARGRVTTPPASVQNRAVIARTAPAAGASRMPVRTVNPGAAVNSRGIANGRTTVDRNNGVSTNNRANGRANGSFNNNAGNNNAGNNNATQPRANSNRPATNYQNRTGVNSSRGNSNRPPSTNYGRGSDSRGNSSPRNYSAPNRSYSAPNRGYSAPPRSYSAPSRTNSAPSRSYSAPSRSNSAPSRGSSAPSHGSSSHSSGGGNSSHGGGNRH
ncbi:MAG: DUF6600 domain-containing protein [Candidatus Acidiferrum sp.]